MGKTAIPETKKLVFKLKKNRNPAAVVCLFLRLFLRMQNGSYGRGGDFIVNYYLKPSFLHSFSRSSVNKRPLTDGWQTYM